MSGNGGSNTNGTSADDASARRHRNSFTQQTLSAVFGRSNSTSGTPVAPFPGPITTAAVQEHRRRMSITTVGLSGTSPTQPSPFPFGGNRRTSVSDRSDSVDESAIDDEDLTGRSAPATPFVRRMSLGAQALRARGSNTSPGSAGEGGFNLGEQLRSRAESAVSQSQRPAFPMQSRPARTQSISEMSDPPSASVPPVKYQRKPDDIQERILKGDFYMD